MNNEIKNFLADASPEEISKIKKLIENKQLTDNFMAKPDFIADVKEIFKSKLNIEINDEDVKHLLQNIEKVANNEPLETLGEEDLKQTAGGVSLKGIRDTAIIGTSSFIGGTIGFVGTTVVCACLTIYGAATNALTGAVAGFDLGKKIVDYLNE